MGVCVTLNGQAIGNFDGGLSISTSGNKLVINGKTVCESSEKILKIEVQGDVQGSIQTASGDIIVDGSVNGGIETASGDIRIGGDIGGDAKSMSGDISAYTISGKASTMSGDISTR